MAMEIALRRVSAGFVDAVFFPTTIGVQGTWSPSGVEVVAEPDSNTRTLAAVLAAGAVAIVQTTTNYNAAIPQAGGVGIAVSVFTALDRDAGTAITRL